MRPQSAAKKKENDMKALHLGFVDQVNDWSLVKVGDLVAQQEVIVIDSEATIEDAGAILMNHGITSAPVYDKNNKSYTGMFDFADLVSYILIALKSKEFGNDEKTFEIKEILQTAIKPVSVRLAVDLSDRNPFYTLYPESSLRQAIDIFATGTHRIAVVNGEGQLKGIVSQSDVVRFLRNIVGKFPALSDVLNKTLDELDMGKKSVISVNFNEAVIDALAVMAQAKVSSIAVVNEKGELFGNLSMTDIKYVLRGKHRNLLWSKCHNYISHIRSQQGIKDGKDTYPVFDVKPNSTLKNALSKIVATKSHRVWVVNTSSQPIGLVSLTDLMGALKAYLMTLKV